MRLVYKGTDKEVQVGDITPTVKGEMVEVTYFREPHKSTSEGKISVKSKDAEWSREFYVSVIGAEWIEREDRENW